MMRIPVARWWLQGTTYARNTGRLMSSQPAEASGGSKIPKSMLDMGQEFAHTGSAGQGLGQAAEARMQQIHQEKSEPSMVRRWLGYVFDAFGIGLVGTAGVYGYYYYCYDIKDIEHMVEETKAKEENAFIGSQWWVRFMEGYLRNAKKLDRKIREYTDPTCDRLLPDLAPELRGRVKTLVLDLDDVLVHKEWTRAKGWQYLKRPGVQDFIFQVAHFYEVVVYTDAPAMYADPIISRLDPQRGIQYRLYRQDTQYHNGKHVRDLSKLNRDLSQVLFISCKPEAYAFQPENTLKLKSWTGDPKDTTLPDLVPFLQMIATRVSDVREVVESYDKEEDVAKAFRQRMQQLAAQHEKQPKQRGFLFGFGSS